MDAQFEIFWLGHAAFKLKTFSGKVVYLDPYKIARDEEKAEGAVVRVAATYECCEHRGSSVCPSSARCLASEEDYDERR